MASVTRSFGTISNNTGVGDAAWANPTNAQTDDETLSTASSLTTTNLSNLWCANAG